MRLRIIYLFVAVLTMHVESVGAAVHQARNLNLLPSAAVNAALACLDAQQKEAKPSELLGWTLVNDGKKRELVDTLELGVADNLYERDGLYLGYEPDLPPGDVRVCEISSEKFTIPEFDTREYKSLWVSFNQKFGLNSPRKWPDSTWQFQNSFVSLFIVTPDKGSYESNKKSIHNSLIYITIAPVKAVK